VQVLPRDHRDRYREEFRTELCELGGPGQVAAAAGLLRGCLSLWYALLNGQSAAQVMARRSMRCRLGRHDYAGQRDVDLDKEHHTSYRCLQCGRYYERKRDEEVRHRSPAPERELFRQRRTMTRPVDGSSSHRVRSTGRR